MNADVLRETVAGDAPPRRRQIPARWRTPALLLAAITAAGLLLRLPSYYDSLFGDELSTYFIVTGHSVGHVLYLLRGHSIDLNPPLFFLLAWLAERFSDSAQMLRLVSLVSGVAAIPLTYQLGVRTVGRAAALVGATLIALSPMLIFYSTEARAYALMMLLVLLATLSLLQALDSGRRGWWALYAGCSCAAVYDHYIAVFYLAALLLWALAAHPPARLPLLAANLAAAVAYIPWLPTVLQDTRSPGNLVIGALEPFGLHRFLHYLALWAVGHPILRLATVPGAVAIVLIVLGVGVGLVGTGLRLRRARERSDIAAYGHADRSAGHPSVRSFAVSKLLVVILALAPPVAIGLYSAIGHSVWEVRNLIAGWPALALTIGALVTSAQKVLRTVAIVLVSAGYGIGAVQMLQAGNQRPNYDAAVSFIARDAAPGDPVIDIPPITPGPLTELDVALHSAGQAGRYHVLRLGYPPLAAILRARPYAAVPALPPTQVLANAARLARGRALFIVMTQGDDRLLGSLFDQLPRELHKQQARTFSGFVPIEVDVYRWQ